MSEIDRIVGQLGSSFSGPAWHGPAVLPVLEGVDAATAARRPIASAHGIWEIVLHMAAWKNYVRRTAAGEREVKVEDEVDWPALHDLSESAWARAKQQLAGEHEALVRVTRGLAEEDLSRVSNRWGQTLYDLLHGIVQHDLYHAGQIAILKKP